MSKKSSNLSRRAAARLREQFFARLGPNAETYCRLFNAAPLLCFYMKDAEGRIMAINRRNCEVCNIRDASDAIGKRSDELFPEPYASAYMALDHEVLRTGKPILGRITQYPADRSKAFMVSDVYPLRDLAGEIIGTTRVYRMTSDHAAEQGHYGHIREVSEYIAQHYAEPLRLKDIVSLSGMSLSGFKRAFADAFNMSPGRYLMTVRLNAARKLLENTDKLLSEIAAETGFFDQSHLTRVFKRERGLTPGQYRRRHNAALRIA